MLVRRSTFEWVLRRAVAAEPGVELRSCGRCCRPRARSTNGAQTPTVGGVVLEDGTEVTAELVVAATGRRGDVPAWLGPSGWTCPRRSARAASCTSLVGTARPTPSRRRSGPKLGGDLGFLKFLVVPGDGGTLSATLAIPADDRDLRRSLSDPDRFDRACRALPGPDEWFAQLDLEPIGGVRPMGGLINRIRHFTDADGGPSVRNFHAVGDAHTCTNPLYGRGCSLALVQSVLLADALRDHDDPAERGSAYEAACRDAGDALVPPRGRARPLGRRPRARVRPSTRRTATGSARSWRPARATRSSDGRWPGCSTCCRFRAELDADPAFVVRAAEIMGDPEHYPTPERPGPAREALLDALAAV